MPSLGWKADLLFKAGERLFPACVLSTARLFQVERLRIRHPGNLCLAGSWFASVRR